MRPLLVGELNPYGSLDDALHPYPEGASGDRLCKIFGLTPEVYLEHFDRTNLCAGSWSKARAKKRAAELLFDGRSRHDIFVLCGAKVCEAFGIAYKPFTHQRVPMAAPLRLIEFYAIPHPSGRNRAWNNPLAVGEVRRVLHAIMPTREQILNYTMPRTAESTQRPAKCSNCGVVVRERDCSDCGPMR